MAEGEYRTTTSHGAARRNAFGGKTVYGARVGILVLDTQYPRIPGDPVNAMTWPFPVLYKVVRTATPDLVTKQNAEGLLDVFLKAADELVAEGADGLTGTCGFLVMFQRELASHCKVPVAMSSLLQVPFVQRLLPPGKRVGILTARGPWLTADHLSAADAPLDTPIGSTEESCAFNSAMNRGDPIADIAVNEFDVLNAGCELVRKSPDVGAVVVECTRMVPYTRALAEELRMPVFDIYNFVCWFHAGLAPRDFGHPGSGPRDFRER